MMAAILSAVIFLLNIVDHVQTAYAIQLFGFDVESNPLARHMYERGYMPLMKIVLCAIMLHILHAALKVNKHIIWLFYLVTVFFIGLVVNNFIVLYDLGAL